MRRESPRVEQLMHRFHESSSASRMRLCAEPGCIQTTREGKPYCPDHVDRHPYVQDLLSSLADREAEEENVQKRGHKAVDPHGLAVKELVLHLSLHGARTVERLSREMQMTTKVLDGYISSLRRRGIVSLGRTNRGSTVVRLTKVLTDDGALIDVDEEAEETSESDDETDKQENAA